MSRDSSRTHLHFHKSHHADLLEDFTRTPLLPDEIFLLPEYQPTNPEDIDDIVPDQHAAFGIRAATGDKKEPIWKDLRLEELLKGFKEEQAPTYGNGAGAGDVLCRRKVAASGGNLSMGSNLRT